jgi:predicted helicase
VGGFSDLFARLDLDPRVRGKQFEHVCKWFLTNDPTYKNTLRRVWLWSEWTGRWGGDSGIDLVAEDYDGRLWAIQAKAYAPENTVTKADVDKFLAESSRAVFSYRLLIATTDKLHHVARRTINDQEKQVAIVGLSDLLTSEVNWHTSPLDMRPSPPPKRAKPREHQREAIRDVVKGFTKSNRSQLIMACGTGKTLTSLFIKEKLDAERVLVLVPSLSLLKQTMQVWRVNAKVPFDALPVCSDETVGRSEEDAAVAHTSELGVPVTTDPSEIAAFLRRRSGPHVVFSTYQSSPQIAAAFALGRVPAFDLVVADEAHRVAGLESSDFATVLDLKAIKAQRRLFMTATPRYFTGRVLKAAQDADLEVASMDDETKFGTVFHRLTFGEAIKRDLLTDYQVAVVGVDNDTYGKWAEKGILVTRDGKKITDARTLAGQIGLAKAMRKYDLHRTISFHSRVARAREFAAEMPEVIAWMPARQRPKGALWSSYASGEMTAGERHVRLQYLSRLGDGERGLLTNARCLSEGVDVPTLDGVAFIDPQQSEVDIVQAVGWAIRKSADKNVGTIVIPVFIDTNEDPEIALDDSAFKPVWDVIKAMRAHDDELGRELDSIRRELGRQRGQVRLPGKIHLDLPARVSSDFARAFDVRLVEQTTATWEFYFGG